MVNGVSHIDAFKELYQLLVSDVSKHRGKLKNSPIESIQASFEEGIPVES